MTANVSRHFRIPRLIILLLLCVLSGGPSLTASVGVGVGAAHPFSALRSSSFSPSGLLVATIGLAALLAHSPAVRVAADEVPASSSQQACPGLNLRPVGRVAMAPSAGGVGTCSERGGDPVRVEAVRGQTLELTSALNLRTYNADALALSMIHWYNSHGALLSPLQCCTRYEYSHSFSFAFSSLLAFLNPRTRTRTVNASVRITFFPLISQVN